MRAMVVREANGDFQLEDREVPEVGPGQVRVKVDACGICHSDAFVKFGAFPGLRFPKVPGHEVAGVIDALGDDVSGLAKGDRVGIGLEVGLPEHRTVGGADRLEIFEATDFAGGMATEGKREFVFWNATTVIAD